MFLVYNHVLFAQPAKKIEPIVWECTYDYLALRDTVSKDTFANDPMILRIGESTSSFFSKYTLKNLDLMAQKADPGNPLLGVITGFLYAEEYRYYDRGSVLDYIYQNYPEGKMTVHTRHGKTMFSYEEELAPQEWTIVPDSTRHILDYTCQLAICDYRGRSYQAWFTPEVAVYSGPWKFRGLPGLIMEVYDNDRHYHYQLTDIRKGVSEPVLIYFFPEQKPSNRKEVATILREGMGKSAEQDKEEGENPPNYDFMERDY